MTKPAIHRSRHIDRLVLAPVVGLFVVIWAAFAAYSLHERDVLLQQVRAELGVTASNLADFDELVQLTAGNSNSVGRAAGSRNAAIQRALAHRPSARLWVVTAGIVSAGQPPAGDLTSFLVAQDRRANFTAYAALPREDALDGWHMLLFQRSAMLLTISAALSLLTSFLIRVLRQRAAAEIEATAAAERVAQLALYRQQLEQTVAERTDDLQRAKHSLEHELLERKAAENALREHDALLNVVTKSAAELLGVQHDDAIALVLELIGGTVAVSRVQLCEISTDNTGHLRSAVRYEWCAPGVIATIDNPALQDMNLTRNFPRAIGPVMTGGFASFYIDDVSGTYRGLFERAQMRSFLQIPVMTEETLWGSLNFVDSSLTKREWTWAESDTLKTLAGLIGVAIGRARYVKELADANMIVQNSPTILYRLRGEPSLPLIYVSHNIVKFGHDPSKLVGMANWSEALIDPDDASKVNAAMARVLEKDAQASTIEFRLRTGDGSRRWVENRYTPVRDKDGRLREVEGIIIDITERKAAEEKIALLARTDGLTGVANRATFVERLRHAFAASRRGAAAFAILYIDLDYFKDVNDTLGHPIGDALLCEVSKRLGQATRGNDVIARLGGDEFAILQTDIGEPANAGTLAAKIVKAMAVPFLIDGNEINISASIGVCPFSAASTSPDVMLAQADLALYRSKDEGRNQYHFHTASLDRQVLERVTLADDLRRALERDELELYYQPQVEVVSGKIVGMEALVRWNHPTRGLLPAASFVPVAEKAGLIVTLGAWVIEQACAQMKRWRDQAVAPPVIAINLSVAQLKNGRELLSNVTASIARFGIAASDLEFDVTEATLAQVTLMQSDVLQQLRLLGSRIAIDDFGTQYSSFEYLRTYRVSHLKIAQSFVNNSISDPERAATIRAIMNIARELDIGVIAEGVETVEQRRMLAATGSTATAQGHYFSEAVGAERAGELLRQGNMGALVEEDDSHHTATLLVALGP